MKNRTDHRRNTTPGLPRYARADEILEFVYNDEQEALCNEQLALTQQGVMPAVQEFLQEMSDFDSQPAAFRWH